MKIDLNGKVALVTGAGGAIGRDIAAALAAQGATVVCTDRDEATCARTAADVPGSVSLVMDVTNEAQVQGVLAQVVERLGRLDVLVNNAGVNVGTDRTTIDKFPREKWDWIMGVDLTGLFLVSKYGAQAMIAQKSGRIINITSVAGLVPLRLQCAFDAAKAGVVNLTRVMAAELAQHGILVNGIAPGSIVMAATRKLFYGDDGATTDWGSRLLSHIPLGRPGECAEVAQGVLFFSDPENTYTTGQVLAIDGGWTCSYFRDF
jgi:3-oxoacyl-[acyl-carrier protein] reductase